MKHCTKNLGFLPGYPGLLQVHPCSARIHAHEGQITQARHPAPLLEPLRLRQGCRDCLGYLDDLPAFIELYYAYYSGSASDITTTLTLSIDIEPFSDDAALLFEHIAAGKLHASISANCPANTYYIPSGGTEQRVLTRVPDKVRSFSGFDSHHSPAYLAAVLSPTGTVMATLIRRTVSHDKIKQLPISQDAIDSVYPLRSNPRFQALLANSQRPQSSQ